MSKFEKGARVEVVIPSYIGGCDVVLKEQLYKLKGKKGTVDHSATGCWYFVCMDDFESNKNFSALQNGDNSRFHFAEGELIITDDCMIIE